MFQKLGTNCFLCAIIKSLRNESTLKPNYPFLRGRIYVL
ncbi:hypothetical protein 7t3_0375 [Salmonella phage 7t3]|nr:hypothetical protein 7t3_0375 [Salmonella phage 7t3]